MIFNLVIEPRAILDIQDAIDYYDSKRVGLGEHFYEIVDEYLNILAKNPFFEIRYKDYRALPIRKFPFIIFYFIDEKIKTVYIMSVFNTSLSPSKYPL